MTLFTFRYRQDTHQIERIPSAPPEGIDLCGGHFNVENLIVEWAYDWTLPGHGSAYSDCGHWRSRGCLNVMDHNQQGIEENRAGKVYIERYQRTCFRAECPICYESWAGKEAGSIAHRLKASRKFGRPIHLIVSPPMEYWVRHDYKSLRKKAYKIAKNSGFKGGSCIFHPFRKVEDSKQWYFSPHFHMLGYGWINNDYASHGWVVKNTGVRKSVSGTAMYQLSHAGVSKGTHTITWFGSFSYNKLKVDPMPKQEHSCPACGAELVNLFYFGAEELPDEKVNLWLDPEGWEVNPRSEKYQGWG